MACGTPKQSNLETVIVHYIAELYNSNQSSLYSQTL